jgi:hypothetical protein
MRKEYDLSGNFVECCDCYTICPCWINEKPDEDHCSGLYVWTFNAGSKIRGHDVGNASVAAATYHGSRSGGQAALFVDNKLSAAARDAVVAAFSGRMQGSLQDLAKLLGIIVTIAPAEINTEFFKGDWQVSIKVAGQSIAHAKGQDKSVDQQARPMSLQHTALSKELGIQGGVTVQEMEELAVSVATLPSGPYQLQGRSGMRGQFSYQ